MYRSDYDNFVKNPVWQEIVKVLEETKKGRRDDLRDIDPITDGGILARQQGRLKMLEFVLEELLEDILREINEEPGENGGKDE